MLRAQSIHKAYSLGKTRIKVLRGVSLSVSEGEFCVIRGASGSGKSTLLHILGALDKPDKGTVEFEGMDVFGASNRERMGYRNRSVGFVFQFYYLLPELSVIENVLAPRFVRHSLWRWFSVRRQARRDAEEVLERVGLSHRIKHRPNELSGGERQRVAIARALINRPTLLLADEPTGNLDESMGRDILLLLEELNRAGQTLVMVTHDQKVAGMAHRRVDLADGKLKVS